MLHICYIAAHKSQIPTSDIYVAYMSKLCDRYATYMQHICHIYVTYMLHIYVTVICHIYVDLVRVVTMRHSFTQRLFCLCWGSRSDLSM